MNNNNNSDQDLSLPKELSGPAAKLDKISIEILSKGEQLIDFSMINPDIAPARLILDRLVQSCLKGSNHRYAVSRGIKKLREGFSNRYLRSFGVTLDPQSQICVTMGSKEAVELVLRYCIAPGSTILLQTPTYPGYVSAAKITGHPIEFFDFSGSESEIETSLNLALQTKKISLLLLNIPDNPSGRILSASCLSRIVERAVQSGTLVLNDFTYGEMGFRSAKLNGAAPASLLSLKLSTPNYLERCLETYSLSKAFSLPGWRVGALLGSADAIEPIMRLKSHLDYGLFLPIQLAAEVALDSDRSLVERTVIEYERRYAQLYKGLLELGFEISAAQAGICIWARLPKIAITGQESFLSANNCEIFAERLLLEYRIRVLPGSVFGEQYADFIRIALVQPEERIRQALEGIESLLRTY